MSKRAILYARTSGDDGKNATSSIDGQLDLCREYANGQGWRVVRELSEDERGVSGARFDAPALNCALELAQSGEFDVLVVRDMDRFARKLAKQLVIEEQFRRAGVDVVYVLEEYADSPEGRLSKHIRATIAEYEREKIKERTLRGRRRSAKRGNVILGGNGAPYGYRKVEKDGRVTLEIVEDEAAIVSMIFDWYTREGLSVRGVVRRLTSMGIPTPADKEGKKNPKKRGFGEWSVSGVNYILRREAYTGTWWYGRYNPHMHLHNPKEHCIAVTVPAIIDNKTWQLAEKRRAQNKAMAARNTRHDYLLRALLRCGRCGSAITAQAMSTPNGRPNLYYRCSAFGDKIRRQSCDMRHFRADAVDRVVWEWVKSIFSNPGAIRHNAELYRAKQAELKKPIHDQLSVTDQLLKQNRQELENALGLYLKGGILQEMLLNEKERLEARIKALETERSELISELEADTITDEQIASLEAFAGEVGEGLTEGDDNFSTRRRLIEWLGLKGKLLDVDGVQMVKVDCHFNEGATLFVSPTVCCWG